VTAPPNQTLGADLAAPETRLAAAFGKHVARWAREQAAPAAAVELVQHAATQVSLATSNGHSCMALEELRAVPNSTAPPSNLASLQTQLLVSRVVGTPDAPGSLPLILDDERLYLHRYYDYECRLARALVTRRTAPPGEVGVADAPAAGAVAPGATVIALLDRLFVPDATDPDAPDWQKIAVVTALLGRLTIISGGPGTGKTTAVVNLLACLLETDPACRIALTAPTGKAAARMTEVIRQRASHLPESLRAQLPTESSTIHRLLGSTPDGEFRHHAGNSLPIDVLIVDEASMLDLALAVHLIEAVPAGARIILLGDKDQLAAVESGAVFAELSAQPIFSRERIRMLARLCGIEPRVLQASPAGRRLPRTVPPRTASAHARHAALDDCVIWLSKNYRFASGSGIGMLAADTNRGDATRVISRLDQSADPSLSWVEDRGAIPSAATVNALLQGYAAYIDAVRDRAVDHTAIATAFSRFRVLCAVRDGPWGVTAINQMIGSQFRRLVRHPLDPGLRSEWYPGRPVMVLRNDRVLTLFNGDIGLVLPDADGMLQVWFPDAAAGLRAIAPVRLPEHETAFAMTVHKSQGSEFDEVLLMLPAESNRVLTRELLYTAVTRARQRLIIAANPQVLTHMVDTRTQRVSGLAARLEIAASRERAAGLAP
jgi:exodeoxyribonuclease V alpha subunit